MNEINPCPACGALLCDQCEDPSAYLAGDAGPSAEAIARASDPLWWAWWDKADDAKREWGSRHYANEIARGEKLRICLTPLFRTPTPEIAHLVERSEAA